MAIGCFNVDTQRLFATFPRKLGPNFSFCFWTRVLGSAPPMVLVQFADSINSNQLNLEIDSGTAIILSGSFSSGTILSATTGAWHFCAATVAGTSPFTITGYVGDANGGKLSSASVSSAVVPAGGYFQISIANAISLGNAFEGDFENLMVWDGLVLNADQLFSQQWQKRPIETQGLYAWYPLQRNADAKIDYAGNRLDLSADTTPMLDRNTAPPVPWV